MGQGHVAKSSAPEGQQGPCPGQRDRRQFPEQGISGLGLGRATHPGFLC